MAETINIRLTDYVNAKDGSLLIKKNGKWMPTTFDELNKENAKRLHELEKLKHEFKMLADNNQHFTKYAKSHFMVVFNAFKIKCAMGEIDITDEELLNLDELVLNDTLSVKEAIEKHEYLKDLFTRLYLDDKEMRTFPQV